MTAPIAFVPDRFHAAAPHYLHGRPAYAPALIRRVAQICRLDGTQRLLDLGCGPGQLSLAFASSVAQALALDPEPAMLDIAAQLGLGLAPNIAYQQGSSYDLCAEMGCFDLTVIGRAFHWMDRADTLARLDALTADGGALALFSTAQLDDPLHPWAAHYRALLERYAQDAPSRVQRAAPDWESHDVVLARSAFAALERVSIVERRRVSAAQLKARPQSMSSLARARLGEKLDTLLADIDEIVAAHSTDGWLIERVESTAIIATRETRAT